MPVSKNSKRSRHSSAGAAPTIYWFAASSAVMGAAVVWFNRTGATLYSGDAEAHLNIARRVVDSRTPGWGQLGTAWLPLPHLLMLPLVGNDWLWRTGLAGAIPAALCMALAVTFLFAAVRRIFSSAWAGSAAAAVFLLNANTLYLGAVPMTEPALYASLCGLLYFTVRYGESPSWGSLAGASLMACAGTLTRYESWFLLPFVAAYIGIKSRRWAAASVFCCVAGLGPALWLVHNWWYFGDALYFYRGPWSALAIQGKLAYPGKGDWRVAAQYFWNAGELIVGLPGLMVGAAGCLAALAYRAFWPLFLLLLPPCFYVWSIHSSGTPIHVPGLWPHAWYNIRYAMAFLPLIAFGSAALAKLGRPAAVLAVLVCLSPFAVHFDEHPITWQEAEINSRGRREWTGQAVEFLRAAAGPNETFFTSFNDMTAIYRTLGVPLHETLTGDNGIQFWMATARPDLLLWEDWAVTMGGDEVQSAVDRGRLHGPHYELSDRIIVKGQPVIEIYHKAFLSPYEHPFR